MKFTAARTARLDQDRAAIDETIDGLLDDVRAVLTDSDPNEVLIALIESFDDSPFAAYVAAGALLRLAAS
jgi:hypothetical protein